MFPFDAEVMAATYTGYNAAVWPAQPVALLLALVVLSLAVVPHPWSGRALGVLLAAGCGPAALFTLGLLLLLDGQPDGRPAWLLLPVPLLWCGIAAVTGWALGAPQSLAVGLLALPTLALFAWRASRG